LKNRPNIVKFTEERLEHYSKMASLSYTPTLVTRTREVYDMPMKYTRGRRTSAYKYFGVCYSRAKTIFINIRLHRSRKSIEHTIAHEVCHMRYPYLSHGDQFEKRIDAMQGGKVSKPPKHKYVEKWGL